MICNRKALRDCSFRPPEWGVIESIDTPIYTLLVPYDAPMVEHLYDLAKSKFSIVLKGKQMKIYRQACWLLGRLERGV